MITAPHICLRVVLARKRDKTCRNLFFDIGSRNLEPAGQIHRPDEP